MKNIGKWIMSFSIGIFTFIPPIADLATNTHVFHDQWLPHARMHTVWLLALSTSLGLLSLYLIWIAKRDIIFNTHLAGLIGLCVYGSFFVSALSTPLYGGALSDNAGGVDYHLHGIDINVWVFAGALVALLMGWRLLAKKKAD